MDYDLKQGSNTSKVFNASSGNPEQGNKQNIQWIDYISPILLTYNTKNEHSAINMTPDEATKEDKRLGVKLNLELKAKRGRKYPELKMGDLVKIMLKYNKMRKAHNPLYSA